MQSLRKEFLLFAALGFISGASFGWPHGWIPIQLCVSIVFARLLTSQRNAAVREPVAIGLFVAGQMLAGQGGTALGGPPELFAWIIGIDLFVVVEHALFAAAFAWLLARCVADARMRIVVGLPAAWVLREWLSLQVDATLPWLAMGYSHAPNGLFSGLFPIGGVLLVSLAVMGTSAMLALAWRQCTWSQRSLVASGVVVVVLVSALARQESWTAPGISTQVAVIQSGITSAEKFDEANGPRMLRSYAQAIASTRAQLVVAPQLAIPKVPHSLPPGYLGQVEAVLRERQSDALLGMYFQGNAPQSFYNGVASIGNSGTQRYLKYHLFPFGEYLPLGPLADLVRTMLPKPMADTARGGDEQVPLQAGGMRLAVAICYESAFGETLRRQATTAQALVNPASDSALDSSQLARQFLQVNQARVLELQKPLIRSSDVRGTYIIDVEGNVVAELPELRHGVMQHWLRGRVGLTPYARFGDAPVLAALVLAFSICVLTIFSKKHAAEGSGGETGREIPPPLGFRRQGGQVLPAALAFMVIIAVLFYFMVNTGQAVTEKIRVTNAADAAAYSAALVEARALNYDAYLNRAMVANQMAIAQTVSFASWIDYFAKASDNMGAATGDINWFMLPEPRVVLLEGAFGGSAATAAYFGGRSVSAYAQDFIDKGAGPIIAAHDVATKALIASQSAVRANLTAGIRQREVARKIVQSMDPSMNAEVVLVSHGFDLFTKNYAGSERGRFADVAVRSRDEFTRKRDWTINSVTIPLLRRNPSLKKRGGTDLIGFDEWRGVDTLELHGQRWGCGRFVPTWCDDVRKPIGWGGIEVDAGGGDTGPGYHGNAYGDNPNTAAQADSMMRPPLNSRYSGIPDSQEISDLNPKADNTTGITIRVWKRQADTLTSSGAAMLKPAGALAVFDEKPAKGDMVAMSRAQVFFDRIAMRSDGKAEIGSLYNPYWRVRLVAPTAADKAYATTKQGLGLP